MTRPTPDLPVAILTLRFAAQAKPAGRRAIATWLRREAKHLERCGKDYAPRFSVRYWTR